MVRKSKAVFYIIVLAYVAGLWLLHWLPGSLKWYWWVAAVILPPIVYYVTMVALWIIEDNKYGKPVICRACGQVYDQMSGCPFCDTPRIW